MYLLPQFVTRRPDDDISHLLNQVHHCDAMALLRRLPDNSVDMVLTSPPYDNLRTYNGFTFPFEAIAKELYRVLKDGGVCVWVVGDATINGSETLTSFRQALYFVDECGFRMHQRIIWTKNSMPTKRKKAYLPDFEDMFVLSKGEPSTFNAIMRQNKKAGTQRRKSKNTKRGHEYDDGVYIIPEQSIQTNVWHIQVGNQHTAKDDFGGCHPAMFPEKLAHDHIYSWSNEDDIVLDIFMGSGTTAKMARKLNRRYIGCDISLEYVELARKRLADTDPFQATTLSDGSKQLSLFVDVGA